MGTRADFYIGRGEDAEWLGSIAWDGYPEGLSDTPILTARRPSAFRKAVAAEIASREDGTTPDRGWPWPWETSSTTDYAYAFDKQKGRVLASCFGGKWFNPLVKQHPSSQEKSAVFPNMKDRMAVTFGKRSGVLIISAGGVVDAE